MKKRPREEPERSRECTSRNMKAKAKFEEEAREALRQTIEALSIGANLTGMLLCRETHVDKIVNFIASDINKTLLLYGMPGTGKTAAVKHALARVDAQTTAVFLNGYVVQRPADVYRTLCQHLTRQRLGHEENHAAEQAAAVLERRFRVTGWGKAKKIATCVIVIDELDKCVEKNPKVLFRIVEWLSLPHAHCRLIGIANSMDLPMDPKTRSRMDAANQVVFQPYTESQLKSILSQRLSQVSSHITVFAPNAIDYVCRQTAAHCGDVRRLLQSTAAAVHNVLCTIEEEGGGLAHSDPSKGLVEFRNVHLVISKVFQDRFRDFMRSIESSVLFLIICVIAAETKRLEVQEAATTPSLPLEWLYRQCVAAMEMYQTTLGIQDAKWLTRHSFLRLLEILREVTLVELAIVEVNGKCERVPLPSALDSVEMCEDIVVTMLQPSEFIKTMCEVHDEFGTKLKSIFT